MSARLCLLLVPLMVSLAPTRKIPDPMRYKNAHGDVIEIADWRRGFSSIVVELKKERTGCSYVLGGLANRIHGNRYAVNTTEGVEMEFRVSDRRVKITRIGSNAFGDVCADFTGVYKRIERN
jgi:hypothetical protein